MLKWVDIIDDPRIKAELKIFPQNLVKIVCYDTLHWWDVIGGYSCYSLEV